MMELNDHSNDLTQNLVDELHLDGTMEEQKRAWQDFVMRHGYAICRDSKELSFLENNLYIPGALYVDCPNFHEWEHDMPHYPVVDVLNQYRNDGGKFINDIYGIVFDTYIDTPKNRQYVFDYLNKHPEDNIMNHLDASSEFDSLWTKQCKQRFADAKSCHFFAFIEADPLLGKLCEMTGEEAYDKYGFHRDEVFSETAVFPNGIEIDIKCVIACEPDETNWCEAVIFKQGHEIGCSDVEEEFFGDWEIKDHDDNVYHVHVAPRVKEVTKQNEFGVHKKKTPLAR